jgi:hypothetical protein
VPRSIPAVLAFAAICAATAVADTDPAADPGDSPGPLPVAPTGPEGATEQLLAPIALYPDPLLAVVLPASTAPTDLAAAATYLVRYGDASRIEGQRWDPSVRALAHYPALLSWMAQNLEWTQALGQAVLASPERVMAAIQSLRARALAAGTLRDTPQERILIDGATIQILPVQPDAIYAPTYDSDVVYSEAPYYDTSTPFMNFGDALPVGGWLSYCFDWANPGLWVGTWVAWHGDGGWRTPRPGKGRWIPGEKRWEPANRSNGDPPLRGHHAAGVPQPTPLAGVPPRPVSHGHSASTHVSGLANTGPNLPTPKNLPPAANQPKVVPANGTPPNGANGPQRLPPDAEGNPRSHTSSQGPSAGSTPRSDRYPPASSRESAPQPQYHSAPPSAGRSAPPPPPAAPPAAAPASAQGSESRNR